MREEGGRVEKGEKKRMSEEEREKKREGKREWRG